VAERNRVRLKRTRKDETIVRDVEEQIRSGELAAGDRLASIKTLCRAYGVSQRIVDAAIAELVRRGLVITRRRSGCYIHEDALESLAAEEAEETPAGGELLDYLRPRPRQNALAVYIADILPETVSLWQTELDRFRRAHAVREVDLLNCLDGHLEEVLGRRHLDLVQSTPVLLAALDEERFAEAPIAEAVALPAAELLPPVQAYLAASSCRSVPYCLTLQYLFVNLDLAAAVGFDPAACRTPEALFAALRAADPPLRRRNAMALAVAGLFDWLEVFGALRHRHGRGLLFEAERARACLRACAGAGFHCCSDTGILEHFREGRLLCMHHCSFEVIELARRADFRWTALPLPRDRTARITAILTVLAVNRATARPELCLELVRHLCGAEQQARRGTMHGNLPVRAAAALGPPALADHPVPEETIRETLAASVVPWPPAESYRLACGCGLRQDRQALLEGAVDVDALVEKLRFCAACMPG
jgi:DNA-binding transcriptional ArsR family regulator